MSKSMVETLLEKWEGEDGEKKFGRIDEAIKEIAARIKLVEEQMVNMGVRNAIDLFYRDNLYKKLVLLQQAQKGQPIQTIDGLPEDVDRVGLKLETTDTIEFGNGETIEFKKIKPSESLK